MAVLRVKDNNGNLIEIHAIKGDKGADGTMTFSDLTEEQKASLKGDKGDTGQAGADGKDGYTPQKGTDYWTPADRSQMVSDVLTALPKWNGGSY